MQNETITVAALLEMGFSKLQGGAVGTESYALDGPDDSQTLEITLYDDDVDTEWPKIVVYKKAETIEFPAAYTHDDMVDLKRFLYSKDVMQSEIIGERFLLRNGFVRLAKAKSGTRSYAFEDADTSQQLEVTLYEDKSISPKVVVYKGGEMVEFPGAIATQKDVLDLKHFLYYREERPGQN